MCIGSWTRCGVCAGKEGIKEYNVNIVHDDFPHAIEYLLYIYLLYVYLAGMVMEWVWWEVEGM